MDNHYFNLKLAFLPLIENGSKDLEVRVADEKRLRIKVGDNIIFAGKYQRKVRAIRRYRSFTEMLHVEDPGRIVPKLSRWEIFSGLRNLYTPEKESLGVLVFELEVST